jgi:para-aminobenzoate synthetase component 1
VAERGRPPLVRPLDGTLDPATCCEQLAGMRGRVLLDSAARGTRLGRYSFLTADPVALVRSKGTRTEVLDEQGTRLVDGDALRAVADLLARHQADPVPGLPPFQGGAAGYIAYDWGRVLERLPAPRYDDLAMPDVVIGIYDWVIAWDHEREAAWLISTGLPEPGGAAGERRARARADAILRILEQPQGGGAPVEGSAPPWPELPAGDAADGELQRSGSAHAPTYPVDRGWWPSHLEIRSSFTHQGYVDAVARVRQYIVDGDIFQANLSQRFEAPLTEPPWTLYRRLRARNATPFAAYLDLPGATVLSASPERFLRVDVGGHVETRPIKGTRPRGVGPEHDAALGAALSESAKDQAENLMIVDLMRNDLSRVCLPGSVRVPELFTLERYATVHHLVSTVEGQLSADADALDLLRATFPGGSITGAPKVRAMEIIAELEPSQRGVYCGSIGYLSVTGALDTNIAIRTLVERATPAGRRVYFSAGGGIVADSDPEQEYRETLDKARGIIDVLVAPRDPAHR